MEAHHDTPFGGHQWITRTIEVVKERYYWKNIWMKIYSNMLKRVKSVIRRLQQEKKKHQFQ